MTFIEDTTFDINLNSNEALILAYYDKKIPILKLLLNDSRTVILTKNISAFSFVNLEIINLILQYKRFGTETYNSFFVESCLLNNPDIINLFFIHKIYSFQLNFDNKNRDNYFFY